MKRSPIHARPLSALLVAFCLLAAPMTAFAKKGEKNFKEGVKYEQAQQWEKAAQEFTLAVAADPSNVEYQLHYRRAVFNASQQYMQQGRALAEQRDYIGAYNAFRQAYGYDPVNELALSEMERMLRLQREKTGEAAPGEGNGDDRGNGSPGPRINQLSYRQGAVPGVGGTPAEPAQTRNPPPEDVLPPQRTEQLRVIKYNGDLKGFIRNLAEQLSLNVIFDSQSFRAPRTVEVNLTDVTTAQALDLIFLQEGLFFQKVNRRTILVADQNRRAQYQQLSIRTFYLSNIAPDEARNIIAAAIPPNQGRPQTVVLPDKATNSITIRDTSENLRLIGEILQSIDKDRAEVVMDVNIYEVSRNDLLQFGNQLGNGGDTGLFSLGSTSGLNITAGSRQVAQALTTAPTALGAALVVPASVLTAFQSKNRTKLLASTQIHAFNGEESSARIGQRVPVQTAQTYPFSTTPTTGTGGGVTNPGVFGGGFPVIQYEPTGLTLKFTPQVFPNLDVQVKMSIESKDILGAGSLTPTFTERTISGTARIQNNRTMMLASVAQDTQSNGRRGLPILGLIPVLGRLFTSPTRNNTQIDIVIAVTPRVLRAPAVTPFDERERPSGTLQTPTTGSLEAMVREADREDQLAAARRLPTNVVVQLPDTEPVPSYVPAPRALMPAAAADSATTPQPTEAKATGAPALQPASVSALTPERQQANALANAIAQLTGDAPPPPTLVQKPAAAVPSAVPMAQQSGGPLRLPQTGIAAALEKSLAAKANTAVPAAAAGASAGPGAMVAELRLMPERQEMRVGEKQRVALVLISNEALGATTARLRFDPRLLAVRGISQGDWPDGASSAPVIMQSIDTAGMITLVIQPRSGAPLKSGESVILFLEVEALAAGEGVIRFGPDAYIVAPNGRGVSLQLTEGRLTVK